MMTKQKIIIIGVVSALIIGGIVLLAHARGHCKYHHDYGHKPHTSWHHQTPWHRYGPPTHWQYQTHRDNHHALGTMFHLEKQLSALKLTQEQRQQVYAVLDEAYPVLRRASLEIANNHRALMQLSLNASNYQQQLNELAAKQAELTQNLIVKMGDVNSQIFALLDEQQKTDFLNGQANNCLVW